MPVDHERKSTACLITPAADTAATPTGTFRDRPAVWGESWRIGVAPFPLGDLIADPSRLASVGWIESPWPDTYLCDPWTVRHAGRDVLFCEVMDRRTRRGHIAVGLLENRDGAWGLEGAKPIVREEHHLSHPCVFRLRGRWYLIPEAADSGSVLLYEADDFPFRWRRCGTPLPDVPGLDPVLLDRPDGLWIACALEEGDGVDGLHLFRADSLDGVWQPHPDNPVCRGPAGSRPAGPIAEVGGRTLRPGQDSRATYGSGVLVHAVERWSRTGYAERIIGRIAPPPEWPWARGLHTISPGPGFCVIDAKEFTGLKAVFGDLLLWWRRNRNTVGA